jgi:hypothetical protein
MVAKMWLLHLREMSKFDNIDEYVRGERGKPSLPTNASSEVKAIRDKCVHNVLDLVVDAFVQNLSVIGYRDSSAQQDGDGWADWQRNKFDARQGEIYAAAVKYGVAYVPVVKGNAGPEWRPRSPRQMIALYEDAQIDEWPQFALETWIDETDGEPRRKGTFYDDTNEYPLDLGQLTIPPRASDATVRRAILQIGTDMVGDPIRHGAGVCPVVRYCNRRDPERLVEGEIDRLITAQQAINEVNFDRMIVARFGAFPQKVITGWTGTQNEVLAATARKVWTFDDDTVKAFTLPAASLEPYNSLLDALVEHVASRAQISPLYINGQLINVNSDTVAAAEANQQRKLGAMRESYGESHEQLLGLTRKMAGRGSADVAAEVVWKDTEARSFGVIADGVIKVAQAIQTGAPITPLLSLLPGVTPQMVEAMKKEADAAAQRQSVTDLVTALHGAAAGARQDPQVAALAGQQTPADQAAPPQVPAPAAPAPVTA